MGRDNIYGPFGAPISDFSNFHFRSCTGPVSYQASRQPDLSLNPDFGIQESYKDQEEHGAAFGFKEVGLTLDVTTISVCNS